MGGSSSTALPDAFQYECDSNVAQFVKSNYFSELSKHVENYADVESVSSGGQTGIVKLRPKVALNTLSTSVADCKKKLDEYFERFLSFEEKLKKIIPRHELDAILNSSRRQCNCDENTLKNSIRITGIKSDVTAIIKRLRSAQEPKPSSRSSSRDSRSSTNQSPITSNVRSSQIVSTSNSGPHHHFSRSQATSPDSSSKATPAYNAFQQSDVYGNQSSTNQLNPTSNTRMSSLPTASISSAGAHHSSNFNYTAPDSSSYTTSAYNANQQPDIFDNRQQSNASAFVSPPAPAPRFTRSPTILPLSESFQCEAPDYAVARFIKHSNEHTRKLDDSMKAVAAVSVVENGRYVGYKCQPIYNLQMTFKDFESDCKRLLATFLNQYDSRKHDFNPNYLSIVRQRSPQLFCRRSRWENEALYVQWYDNRLIISGPEDDVINKEKEILDSLNAILPIPASTVVKIPADDYSVALFLKQSSVHMQELTNAFSQLASVKLWQVSRNDGSGRDRQVEYRFTPAQNTNLTDSEFEVQCRTILDQFLKGYSAEKKFFNRDHLMKAKSIVPAKFFEKQPSCDDLYVEWRLDLNRLLIVGPVNDVKHKMQEITEYLNETVPRTPRLLKLPALDMDVAKFLDHSTSHSTRLQDAFKAIATVKISSNQRRPDRQFMEYHFKALPSVTLSEDDFKALCETTIDKFLENYSSSRKFFSHDRLKRAKSIVPEYFQTQASQEEVFVKWPSNKSCVIVVGLSNEVQKKVQEITSYLDQVAPRYLKHFYEFDLDPPSITVSKFVKEKEKHFDALKNAIEDAEISIGAGKFSLHFKATIQLTQSDLPEFENKRKSEAIKFFRKFETWRQRYPRNVIEKFRDEHSELLTADDTDWKLEIANDNEVVLTGILSQLADHKALILHVLEKASKVERQPLEKSTSPSRPTPTPRRFLGSPDHLNHLLMFQPRGKDNSNILKHIFQSPMDMIKLQNVVGSNIQFQPFPNPVDPEGIKFANSDGSNITQLQQDVRMFFLQFAQCSIQFLNPHQKDDIIHVVYDVGQRFKVPDRMMSIQEKLNVLFIIGLNDTISVISERINGFFYIPMSTDLLFFPPPEERRSSSSPLPQSPSSSRRSSISSQGSQSTPKKTKNRQKKEDRSGFSKRRETNKQLQNTNYSPKTQFRPMFEFVLNESRFFDELQSRCVNLCTLEKYPGRSDALKATEKKPEMNHKQFSKKVVEKMEEFLSSVSIAIVPLDAVPKDDFEQIKSGWLEKFYDSSDWVVLSWQETNVEIKGFEKDVQKYVDLLKEDVTETKIISESVLRSLIVCGVLAEVNRRLSGKMVISCSEDGNSLVFKGKALFYDMSVKMLAEVGHLVEIEPLLEEDKLKALKIFLSNEGKMENEEFIREKFATKNIKCI